MTKSEISKLVYEISQELLQTSSLQSQYNEEKKKNPNLTQTDLILLVSDDAKLFTIGLVSKALATILGTDG